MGRVPMALLRIRLLGAGLAGLTALAAATPAFADADPIHVKVDHAKVMHIARPADIVIIGNPGIADATIQDSQTLIITGHSFGTTNLIVLDSAGQAIADELVTVEASDDDVVTVYRVDKQKGTTARETFSCTPSCAPTLAIGDSDTWFSGLKEQIEGRGGVAGGSAAK